MDFRSEKYINICCDSQAYLKALKAAKTTSSLVASAKGRWLISPPTTPWLIWVPGHVRIRGNETADELARKDSAHQFIGPDPALGVWRRNIRQTIRCWLSYRHTKLWQGFIGTQRLARALISGRCLAASSRLLSFHRTQPRMVTGLFGHITLRRHLYVMGLTDNPLCGRCGAEEETWAPVRRA